MKKFLFILLLLASAIYYFRDQYQIHEIKNWVSTFIDEDSANKLKLISRTRKRQMYRVYEDRWLKFNVEKAAMRLKVVSSASVKADINQLDENSSWPYSIEYELYDDQGKVVESREYHHRTGVVLWKNIETGKRENSTFYIDNDLIPCQTRDFIVLKKEGVAFSSVGLRIKYKDSMLKDVSLSLYSEFEVPKHRQRVVWHRISPWKKEQLAKSNIYPAYLLREDEKLLLASRQWKPMGPVGIRERDWELITQYVRLDFDGIVRDTPNVPIGSVMTHSRRGVLRIPEGGQKVLLKFEKLNFKKIVEHEEGSGVILNWTSSDGRHSNNVSLKWQKGRIEFEGTFDEGLLEVVSQENYVFQAFDRTGDTLVDITPVHTRVRVFSLESNEQKVVYQINHKADKTTPFRLDFRGRNPEGQNQMIEISLLDQNNKEISKERLSIMWERSYYDQLMGSEMDVILSEPVTRFFAWSAKVHRIEIRSEAPLLIGAYNRPPGVAREIDLTLKEEELELKQPMWFSVLPENDEQLRVNRRSYVIQVPPRPRQIDEDIAKGDYIFEDFFPQGSWLGSYLLIPLEADKKVRRQAMSQMYCELKANQKTKVELIHPDGLDECRTRLIYQGVKTSNEIILLKNGFEWMKFNPSSSRGVVRPPSVETGKHEIEIRLKGEGRFYLSHVSKPNPTHMRKSVIKLNKKNIEISIEKKTDETENVSIKLYSPKVSNPWMNIHLLGRNIKENSTLDEWSFDHKKYKIVYSTETLARSMNTRGKDQYVSPALFVTLGKEMAKGDYKIKVNVDQFEQSHLSLSRLIPGEHNRRRIYSNVSGSSLASIDISEGFNLKKWIKDRQHPKQFKSPNIFEMQKAEALFQKILRGNIGESVRRSWKDLGMDMQLFMDKKKPFLVVGESLLKLEGRGIFLFRMNDSRPVLLQCPHAFKDLHTGKISLDVFSELPFQALSMNTHQRYAHKEGGENPDMSDRRLSYFNALMKAFVRQSPEGRVVQIHGFAREKRKQVQSKTKDMILSSGTKIPSELLNKTEPEFRNILGKSLAIYPKESNELGGTTNIQGKIMREMQHQGFLHVEMSRELRDKILKDAEWKKKIFNPFIE